MMIYHDFRTQVPIHRHQPYGEYILLMEGECKIVFYDESLSKNREINLRKSDSSLQTPVYIEPGAWHSLHFKTYAIFYEISPGADDDKVTEFASGA